MPVGGFIDRIQGAKTMKLTASVMLTVDGLYQGPGTPTRIGATGSSAADGPIFNDEVGGRFLTSWFERADALLIGQTRVPAKLRPCLAP